MKYIGQPFKRKIDPRLIKGGGRYIADIRMPGALHAAFLRSPYAHARIHAIRLEKARAMPGVAAVFGPEEAKALPRLPFLFKHPNLVPVTQKPLDEVVHHVGEPVAMVVAASRYLAEDALELIQVDYEQLPAVAHMMDAIRSDAPLAHESLTSNIAAHFVQRVGDAEAAMREAPVVVRHHFNIGRVSCLPIETRGLLAHWRETGSEPVLEVYATTQSQHEMRKIYADSLGISEHQVRVIAPDVGGAFGAKAPFYAEDLLVAWASRQIGAPVQWIEDRMEHMMSCIHEREQRHEAALGVDSDGRILAVTDTMIANNGAYVPWGIIVPLMTSTLIPGPYKVPNYLCDVTVVYTNTVPHAPFRGAGRPQAALILNRLLDQAAAQLGLDPLEIRRRNLIQPEEFPYKTGLLSRDGKPQVYDSGNYPKMVAVMREIGGYEKWRRHQAEARRNGRLIGLGTVVSIENTGFGSFEGATVRVEYTGDVSVFTGAATQGQGHDTTLGQVAAEVLDVPLERVTVREGDTHHFPYGTGTFASRIAAIVGTAVYNAALEIRGRALKIAAHLLQEDSEQLELRSGYVVSKTRSSVKISLGEVAHHARGIAPGTTYALPVPPGLEVTQYFAPPGAAITSMADMAVVELDPETCQIKVLDYTTVHDNGRILNPLILKGQIHGGISNGLGTALYEEIVYDEQGQLLTSTLMDYLVPTACEVPDIQLGHIETLSPLNPLGIKGAGESGTIPVPAAIQSAVEDALRAWGIKVEDIPVKPWKLRKLMKEAKQANRVKPCALPR
jgi:carbon-monoxide dehydrogenase large subunit